MNRVRRCFQALITNRLRVVLIALCLFLLALLLNALRPAVFPAAGPFCRGLSIGLFLASYLLAGSGVLKTAWALLKNKDWMNEYFLMSLATFGALALQAWPEAAAVMIFYEIGERVQNKAVAEANRSIARLLDLSVDAALVRRENSWKAVLASEVRVGETILIQAGERVPLDGVVRQGRGEVDSSALTGESLPLAVEAGDPLYSGSLNLHTPLEVQVTEDFDHSTLSKIISMSEDASLRKGQTERLITRLARYYTPLVVLLALFMALVPPLWQGGTWIRWFSRALNLLIISCPCALVLSVPLSYFIGMGLCSSRGILVRGSDVIEGFARASHIIFDKTGTLTHGKLQLLKTQILDPDSSEHEILRLATRLEEGSTHPLAEALRRAAAASAEAGCESSLPVSLEELPGYGVKGSCGHTLYYLGNARLMQDLGLTPPAAEGPYSTIYLAEQSPTTSRILAFFCFGDTLKANAASVLQELRSLGVGTLTMLSGDRKPVLEKVAHTLPLDHWEGELLPQDKLVRLEAQIAKKSPQETVVFVGDGVNDAPALSLADVGIAMGAAGSDAAVEAADMVLMRDDLSALPEALRIARRTNRVARQNIIIALGLKVLVIGLSAFGLGGMWAAIFADVGVTLLCIANSFQLPLLFGRGAASHPVCA